MWGESGTGKEVVARLIHELSPRSQASFVAVNCGAIPAELMESEFFGHKKGSFTGATTDKDGLFQQANGGTLFLDEVADLPLTMQVKLLRAIQEKRCAPSVAHKKSRLTSACYLPPTKTSPSWSRQVNFGKICITEFTSLKCVCQA
nr:sigma-54 factor interaction domain-containing protein [Moraxella atlantae]